MPLQSSASARLRKAVQAPLGGPFGIVESVDGVPMTAMEVRGGSAEPEKSSNHLLNAWRSYLNQLDTRPLLTKGYTSLVISAAGDVLGQKLAARTKGALFMWDMNRTVLYTIVGVLFGSTAVHYWFDFLDKKVADPNRVKGKYERVLLQLLVDQTVGATVLNAGFYIVFTALSALVSGHFLPIGGLVETIQTKLTSEMWPTLCNNWKLWPAANFVNFAVIPPPLRVLFANFVAIFWNAYLSNSVVK